MTMRQATLADIDSVAKIVLASTDNDPDSDYRFPFRKQYEKEYITNIGLIFEYFLKPEYDDYRVMVINAPIPTDPHTNQVAAVAVWDISYINKRKHGDSYKARNPDKDSESDPRALPQPYVDQERRDRFRSVLGEARKRHFTDVYGAEQIHLNVLATHPDHWRRGYASALVRWGMAQAKEDGVVLTNFASVMGMNFYPRLGFRHLGDVVVQVPGQEEKVTPGMFVYDPTTTS